MGFCVYIRCCGNGCCWFRPYGGSLCKSGKVTKTLLPHHSVPRLGSACLNVDIAPWAAAMGHPWPSAAKPASCRFTHGPMPTFSQRGLTGRLRSRSKADQEHSGLPAGLSGVKHGQGPERKQSCFSVGAGLPATASPRSFRNTEVMPSQASQLLQWTVPAFDLAFASHHSSRPVGRCALDLLLTLILGAPLNHAGRTQVLRSG